MDLYLWMKALHIIAMVAWFSGIFYLPRLFVYHVETFDTAGYNRFCTMERRLYWNIMTPAAIVTIFLGLGLMHRYAGMPWWLMVKLGIVGLAVGYHLLCGYYLRKFAHHQNRHSARFFRIINEIPVLFLAAIVILVVVQPGA